MANFFYTDAQGNKQGPLTPEQLQTLADRGTISPATELETESGQKGKAGQIRGLKFPTPEPSPFEQTVPATPAPPGNLFCTNCGNSVSEQAVACMSCGARPTGHKKFCRQCGVGLNPEQVVCIKCGAAITSNVSTSKHGAVGNSRVARKPLDIADTTKKINTFFKWFCVCLKIMVCPFILCPLLIFFGVVAGECNNEILAVILVIFGIFCGLVATGAGIALIVFVALLLYLFWRVIPEDIARTTPGKAVGFIFIPFFNLYWAFIAFWGLSEDMNATLQQRGIQYQVNEKSGLVYCILFACGAIPYIGVLPGIAALVFLYLFFKSVKDGAIALLERG